MLAGRKCADTKGHRHKAPSATVCKQGGSALAPGAMLASVNLRVSISGSMAVPVPWTLVVQSPNYVGRVQQAHPC